MFAPCGSHMFFDRTATDIYSRETHKQVSKSIYAEKVTIRWWGGRVLWGN